jgi:hypothetical protein
MVPHLAPEHAAVDLGVEVSDGGLRVEGEGVQYLHRISGGRVLVAAGGGFKDISFVER